MNLTHNIYNINRKKDQLYFYYTSQLIQSPSKESSPLEGIFLFLSNDSNIMLYLIKMTEIMKFHIGYY